MVRLPEWNWCKATGLGNDDQPPKVGLGQTGCFKMKRDDQVVKPGAREWPCLPLQ